MFESYQFLKHCVCGFGEGGGVQKSVESRIIYSASGAKISTPLVLKDLQAINSQSYNI